MERLRFRIHFYCGCNMWGTEFIDKYCVLYIQCETQPCDHSETWRKKAFQIKAFWDSVKTQNTSDWWTTTYSKSSTKSLERTILIFTSVGCQNNKRHDKTGTKKKN